MITSTQWYIILALLLVVIARLLAVDLLPVIAALRALVPALRSVVDIPFIVVQQVVSDDASGNSVN